MIFVVFVCEILIWSYCHMISTIDAPVVRDWFSCSCSNRSCSLFRVSIVWTRIYLEYLVRTGVEILICFHESRGSNSASFRPCSLVSSAGEWNDLLRVLILLYLSGWYLVSCRICEHLFMSTTIVGYFSCWPNRLFAIELCLFSRRPSIKSGSGWLYLRWIVGVYCAVRYFIPIRFLDFSVELFRNENWWYYPPEPYQEV